MKKVIITLIAFMHASTLFATERVPGTKVSLDPPWGFVKAKGDPLVIVGSSILKSFERI